MQAIDSYYKLLPLKLIICSGGALNCPIVFRGPNGVAAPEWQLNTRSNYASWYAHCPGLQGDALHIPPADA